MSKKILALVAVLITLGLKAQSIDPLRGEDAKKQQRWVDSIMKTMSLDEKIGQLFMVQAYSNKGKQHKTEIINMIKKYHIGNLIFMKGTPVKQVVLNNEYQSKAKVPLLIGFDGEWGLDMRLKDTYRFPWNMTLGAIQDNELIEAFGKRLGKHCKRVGIHVNFAPVVDINTNPKNPIIGNRSFGESKENVTQKAIAFTKGMQSVGVLANAKHFPGHGDTATDSHKTLPTVSFSEKRLDSIELYPYKKIFDAGVASVMVGHLSVPSLEKKVNLPSSLSSNIVTKLLKQKLGFLGLIFTDGLNMGGAANYSSPADINLAAFLAGNDVLLIPEDIPNTVALFKKSIQNQILSEKRINHSVEKILRAKYLAGLHNYKPIETANLIADLNTPEDEVLHRRLVKKSITILKNTKSTLPIKNLEAHKIAYVKLGDSNGNHFVNTLKKYTKVDVISSKNLQKVLHKLEKYNLVIIGFHKSNKSPWKSYNFTKKDLIWLKKIAKKKRVILDVFTSPYSLLKVKSFKNIENIIVSYQNSKIAQELSAQAIFGAFSVEGKLPVSINPIFKVGDGVSVSTLSRMGYTIPEEVGMSSEKISEIEKYIDTILKYRMTPGLQVLIARYGEVIYQKSFGYHTYSKKRKVQNTDLYDLASMTKILASLPMVMKAEEENKLTLKSRLKELLPNFSNSNKDTLSVKQILSHNAKLISWIPFYRATKNKRGEKKQELYSNVKTKKYSIEVAKDLYLINTYKDSILTKIKNSEQRTINGYKYSDLGYYILKEVLEDKYHEKLNVLTATNFYKPLGLSRTSYLPLEKFKKEEIVPTERDTYFRNQLLHGYVHDMGAAMQGGVGGHAGLFANANDVGKIMQMFLQKGYYGGKRYFKSETINKFNKRYYANLRNRRGVGFDKPQISPAQKATCGCVSEQSFGHSGFTGTYAWADPESGIVYVFLSNRVYPTAKNNRLVRSNIRTKIQKVIQDAIN